MNELVSKEYMKKLGGTCIAARDTDGDLYPIAALDELPLAYSEIIRCKECKWWKNYGDTIGDCHNPRWGDGHGWYRPPETIEDDFCCDGEKEW